MRTSKKLDLVITSLIHSDLISEWLLNKKFLQFVYNEKNLPFGFKISLKTFKFHENQKCAIFNINSTLSSL